MPLSRKQLEAVGLSDARVNLWDGSVRSGKTFSSILRFLTAVSTASRYGEVVIVGKNRDSIYRNFFAPIDTLPELSWVSGQVSYRQGAATGKVLGRRVNVLGANDAKAESRIRGMTVTVAYVDEVTVIPEDFFKQLLARMSAPGAQLFGTTNPDSPAHWLKAKYLDRLGELPDWRYFRFTLDDNPVLTQEYKDSLKREYTGLWYRRFIEGEWVAAEGAIYDTWDPDTHVTAWENMPLMRRFIAVGVDYGTTNPTSAILVGQDNAGHYWLVDEYRYDPAVTTRRLTDRQLAERLWTWLLTKHTPHDQEPLIPPLVVDPAAASFKVELMNRGIPVRDANNQVAHGIARVASLLGANQLHVTDRCQGFITEAPGYSWDPKATEAGEDKPIKTADHSLDAARYGLMVDQHRAARQAVTGLG